MEEYDKIEVGISANKVKELIGEPSDIEKYKSYSLYRYGGWDSKGEMTVYFDKMALLRRRNKMGYVISQTSLSVIMALSAKMYKLQMKNLRRMTRRNMKKRMTACRGIRM